MISYAERSEYLNTDLLKLKIIHADSLITYKIINRFCFTSLCDHFVYAPTCYNNRGHSVRICSICKNQHIEIFFL